MLSKLKLYFASSNCFSHLLEIVFQEKINLTSISKSTNLTYLWLHSIIQYDDYILPLIDLKFSTAKIVV